MVGDEQVEGVYHRCNCITPSSAGDSHTAALTEEGEVWAWGTFRDSSGAIGLVAPMQIERAPVRVLPSVRVTKLASGSDHLALLGSQGDLWTLGNGEQGQLGRVMERFSHRGGRRGLTALLNPAQVHLARRQGRGFTDVWAGSYNTVAVTQTEEVRNLCNGKQFIVCIVGPAGGGDGT